MDVTPSGISHDVIPEFTLVMVVTLYVRLLFLMVAGIITFPLSVFVTVAELVEASNEYVIPSMVSSAKVTLVQNMLRTKAK